MKVFKIFLAAGVLFFLERLFFARIEILSLTPWLGFAFCLVGAALSVDTTTAIVTAAVYGLISDLTGDGTAGSAMLSFALSAGAVRLISSGIFKNSVAVTLMSVFVVGILGEMLYYLLNSRGLDVEFGRLLWSVALPLSVINTVFALVLYPVCKRLFAKRRSI